MNIGEEQIPIASEVNTANISLSGFLHKGEGGKRTI